MGSQVSEPRSAGGKARMAMPRQTGSRRTRVTSFSSLRCKGGLADWGLLGQLHSPTRRPGDRSLSTLPQDTIPGPRWPQCRCHSVPSLRPGETPEKVASQQASEMHQATYLASSVAVPASRLHYGSAPFLASDSPLFCAPYPHGTCDPASGMSAAHFQ